MAQVSITASTPLYNFQVLPGSTRQIYASISGGLLNTVNWTVLSTTGGASATFTTPTVNSAALVDFGPAAVKVNIGTKAGMCAIAGSMGAYSVSSTATVTVQAQSVDNPIKSATFLFNVCAKTTAVIVAPAYQQAFKSQHRSLQSWVTGNTDETGTWSIVSQPAGGDGALADTTNRDADFMATVTGRYILKYTSVGDPSQSSNAIVYVSPNNLPAYASTPNETEPRECYADPALTGPDYEVGSGKPYTTISSVPSIAGWTPGTILRIWNTDSTGSAPTVFHEYFQIAKSGTPTQPIIVCGVPDSIGNLPILDANNAVGQVGLSTGAAAGYGILSTWAGPPTPYGYQQSGSAGPSYVSITGLHLRNANPGFTYTPPGGGAPVPWIIGAACINLRSGSYIDVSGNDMDSCTNGFFSAENSNSAWAPITQNITVTGNHIHGSGWATDASEHQVYFQSFYGLFEGNRVDNYVCTSQGSNVKWRGLEGILRYNYLGYTSGCAGPLRDFDLVDVQDAEPYVSFEAYLSSHGDTNCNDSLYCLGDTAGANLIAAYQESLQKDFVYGNLISAVAGGAIHYNGDHAVGLAERQGILYFYSNTMPGVATVFDTGNNGDTNSILNQEVDAQNNIFWNTGSNSIGNYSALQMNRYDSLILNSTTNLYAAGSISIGLPIIGGVNTGTIGELGWGEGPAGGGGCYGTVCPWPLTSPLNTHFYGLTASNFISTGTQPFTSGTLVPQSGSAAIGVGTPLNGVLSTMPVRWNFNELTNALTPRQSPLTIGAEDPSVSVPTAATPAFGVASGAYATAQSVTISTSTPSAKIYYTTDGTTPTTSSSVYSGPVSVSATETLQAIAIATGYSTSAVGSAAYTINLVPVSTPTFNPAAGTYTSAQMVTISTITPSATIYYTTNGTTPTTSSTVYSGAVAVSANETVKALAVASGLSNSVVGQAVYTINLAPAATPIFSPAGGTYGSPQTVTISSATPAATIYYTTNGTTPTTSSTVYSGAITVSVTETVEAIAVATGYTTSATGTAVYTINLTPAATPSFSPAGGTYSSAQTMTISTATPAATIYYTTNGTTPTASSAVYSGPITVSTTETVKAIAGATGYTASAAGSVAYTINLPQGVPMFSPAGGTYGSAQTVTISTATPAATIYYTTNGTTPTTSSAVYSGPITVSASATVQAIAVSTGYSNSAVGSAAYTINLTQGTPSFSPAGGTFSLAQTVTISTATPSATIYYTTNGTAPTTSSAVYSGSITVSASETVEAIAVATGYSASGVGSAVYTINQTQGVPAFSPAGGSYGSTQIVTISTTTPAATIYYTTNGTTPTTGSPVYSGPITVSASETVEAIAVATGYSASGVGSAAYAISVSTPSFTVALTSNSLAVAAGQSATNTVMVTPLNGFASPVTLSCSGLPAGAACNFSPSTLTPTGSVASTTLTVTTSTTTAALPRSTNPLFPGSALAALVCCFGWKRRRGLQILLLAALAVGLGFCTTGCSVATQASTQAVASSVTVTATYGTLRTSTSFTLLVQ